jgi:hypothetical protein
MAQLNINLTPEFQRDLALFMRMRNIRTKSEAIRTAVRECVKRSQRAGPKVDFSSWIGMARRRKRGRGPRFHTDDDLWGR